MRLFESTLVYGKGGGLASNYSLEASSILAGIFPKDVSVTGVEVVSKTFDPGNNAATLNQRGQRGSVTNAQLSALRVLLDIQ